MHLPEHPVLVGVIKRKKDFKILQTQHWYRIPKGHAERGMYARYVAFFMSGRSFGDMGSSIRYYATLEGHELHKRIDLLPDEPKHKHANRDYYRLSIGDLQVTRQPITNPSNRRFAFIHTTWDRFSTASTLDDLYSREDSLVDRLFYALRDEGLLARRQWQLPAIKNKYPPQRARLSILCEDGEDVIATPYGDEGIPIEDDIQKAADAVKQKVYEKGGAKLVNIPLE